MLRVILVAGTDVFAAASSRLNAGADLNKRNADVVCAEALTDTP